MLRKIEALRACAGVAVVVLAGSLVQETSPVSARPEGPALDRATLAQIRKLQEERCDVLRKAVRLRMLKLREGSGRITSIPEAARELLRAELELAEKAAAQLAAHQRHFEALKALEDIARNFVDIGELSEADYQCVRAARLEAEIGLLRAGGKVKKADRPKKKGKE